MLSSLANALTTAVTSAVTGNGSPAHEALPPPDESLLQTVQNAKTEKECLAFVRKAFKGVSRPDTRESTTSRTSTDSAPPSTQIDINLQEKRSGNTALMFACKRNFAELARLLVDKGASTVVKNKKGERASAFVKEGASGDLKSYLQELEVDEEAQIKERTICDATEQLRAAIVDADVEALEKTVAALVYPEETWRRKVASAATGRPPLPLLELLVEGGREDVLAAYVRGGGDVSLPGPRGRTLLHQVTLFQHERTVFAVSFLVSPILSRDL